jgi:hypothetical protein
LLPSKGGNGNKLKKANQEFIDTINFAIPDTGVKSRKIKAKKRLVKGPEAEINPNSIFLLSLDLKNKENFGRIKTAPGATNIKPRNANKIPKTIPRGKSLKNASYPNFIATNLWASSWKRNEIITKKRKTGNKDKL